MARPPRPTPADRAPHRRAVLAGLAAVATAAAAPAAPAQAPARVPAAPAPLPADGQPTTLLEARPGVADFGAGGPTDVWGFGGRVPGPVIRLRAGEPFRARIVDSLAQPLSLHWHGLRIPSDMDGVGGLSLDPAPAGGIQDLRFTPPDPGTAIYRPCIPGLAGEQAERGLAGVCVVAERTPYPVDLDHVVAVDDWRLGGDGQLEPFGDPLERAGPGRLGTVLTVNGVRAPETMAVAPKARVRLRLANLCNARILRVRFDNLRAYVIAVDGQPTDTFEPLRATLPFAPGSRYDLVLDMPAEAGATGRVVALVGDGMPLLVLRTEGDAPMRPDLPPIGPLPENRSLPPSVILQRAQRAELVIDGGGRPGPDGRTVYSGDPQRIWRVNGVSGPVGPDRAGKPGAFGKPFMTVRRGSPVVLAVANRTAYPQVIHVHGHVFRLLHALDDGWEPYWLDTVIVPENRTVRLGFHADAKGRWLVASTVLERFDTGLSAWFEVV